MKRLKWIAVAAIILLVIGVTGYHSFGQTDEDAHAKEKKEALLLKYPLPLNNVQLKLVKSFPNEDQIGQDIYLKGAMSLYVDDSKNLIYVCDNDDHKIMVFDKKGEFLKQIGQFGQGPSDLCRPFSILPWQDYLVVNDVGNLRVQILDKNGKYVEGFRTFKNYFDMAISKDGVIYGVHINKYNEPYLCDALSSDGKLLFSFGKKLDIQEEFGLGVFPALKIFVDQQGDVYLAYLNFSVIRKYSKQGKLLKEFSLNFPQMNDQKKKSEEYAKSKTNRSKVMIGFDDFWVENGKIYSILRYPMLEIVEFDDKGEALKVFWNNDVTDYLLFNFWIGREEGKMVFYVARVLPDKGVDIFKY